jgi:hypothetical protein
LHLIALALLRARAVRGGVRVICIEEDPMAKKSKSKVAPVARIETRGRKALPDAQRRSDRVVFPVNAIEAEQLDAWAAREGRPMAELVRALALREARRSQRAADMAMRDRAATELAAVETKIAQLAQDPTVTVEMIADLERNLAKAREDFAQGEAMLHVRQIADRGAR